MQPRASFKLDVRSQKAQGIYNNTSNSLTGASASSGGAIHYATALPPSNPVATMRGYKAKGSKGLMPIRKKKGRRAHSKHSKSYTATV